MTEFVAFLRAVNVAGHARVRMSDVRDAFTAAGCQKVRSYIQSGNILFEARAADLPKLKREVGRRIADLVGKDPVVIYRNLSDVKLLTESDPFSMYRSPEALKFYVVFLAREAKTPPELPLDEPREALTLIGLDGRNAFVVSRRKKNGMYGFPNNVVERTLGVEATSRNWTTVNKLAAMSEGSR